MSVEVFVRQIGLIEYQGLPFSSGVRWQGGVLGGDVWVPNGKRSSYLVKAARQNQQWGLQTFWDSVQFAAEYREACHRAGLTVRQIEENLS
jgi:hypothetical protein